MNQNVKKYDLVSAKDADKLRDLVEAKLKQGWELNGSPFSNGTMIMQNMTINRRVEYDDSGKEIPPHKGEYDDKGNPLTVQLPSQGRSHFKSDKVEAPDPAVKLQSIPVTHKLTEETVKDELLRSGKLGA